METEQVVLEGVIEHIVYKNYDTGFTVLQM